MAFNGEEGFFVVVSIEGKDALSFGFHLIVIFTCIGEWAACGEEVCQSLTFLACVSEEHDGEYSLNCWVTNNDN